ncbi:capsid maturation protein [Mycobacterium phage Cambiare]|uniref:Capsid maturation protein n=1 Tax=Mycobacterium phage Cambiare TaxID=1647305 RepID=A0A0F6SJN1_9CAUD|nr:head maturation protease [Mycobacterium phage Cambiare]AKF14507.1 capsid maturation protein [Mycobacterium phage Cambiare]
MATGAPEFQAALVKLGDRLAIEARKVTTAVARLGPEDARRVITDAYPEIASPYLAAAGDLSATWYEEQPTKSRRGRLFIARPADLPPADALAVNGRWALTQTDPAGALEGSSRRQMFTQSRQTILNNTEDEGTRWIRHARAGACGFCRMLATRPLTVGHGGAPGLYRTEGTASRNTHRFETGHDRCRCIVLPLREGAEYVAPDYLPQWLEDYYAVSRDADGRLLPPRVIAERMEAVGRERGDYGDVIHRARGEVKPDVVDLDRAPVARARQLTERNAERVDQAVQPAVDRVKQAKDVAVRADQFAQTAVTVTGRTKQVVDVADRLLGGTYPAVRQVKTLVDAADKAAQSAAGVTSSAATVTRVAERTLRDTTAIAHGVKQIVDETAGVLDEAAAIALGARELLSTAGTAAADVRNAGGLSARAQTAVDNATRIRDDARALLDRARGTVEQAQNTIAAAGELPARVQAPLRDLQSLANHVQNTAQAAQMAGADAGAVAAQVRALTEGIRDARRAARTPEPPREPVKVTSERVDRPAPAGELPLEPLDVEAFDLPEAQLAIERTPAPLAIEARPALKELTAGPDRPPVPNPDEGQIADWLAANDDHWAALERFRAEPKLPPAEILEPPRVPDVPDPIAAGVLPDALEAVVEDRAADVVTKGDKLRAALAEAKRVAAEPDTRKTAQGNTKAATAKRQQRQFYNKSQVQKAQAELDAAIADGTVDDVLPAAKPKRAAGRRPADVEAELRAAGDAAIQKSVDDFERAVATGDDDLIDQAADHMDAVEKAEMARRAAADERLAKLAAKNERLRARREAEREAEQRAIYDEIGELVGEDASIGDYHLAEAQVIARRTGRSESDVLQSIRKREFMRTAEVKGDGFEDTLKAVFRYEVHKAYQLAEAETNGVMVRRASEGKFDPLNLWYASDATARKHMSEEMANWFDANGRITLPLMRQMILDGDENFARRTVMDADYNQ